MVVNGGRVVWIGLMRRVGESEAASRAVAGRHEGYNLLNPCLLIENMLLFSKLYCITKEAKLNYFDSFSFFILLVVKHV